MRALGQRQETAAHDDENPADENQHTAERIGEVLRVGAGGRVGERGSRAPVRSECGAARRGNGRIDGCGSFPHAGAEAREDVVLRLRGVTEGIQFSPQARRRCIFAAAGTLAEQRKEHDGGDRHVEGNAELLNGVEQTRRVACFATRDLAQEQIQGGRDDHPQPIPDSTCTGMICHEWRLGP